MKKLTPILLKAHPDYNEAWLQEQIAKDPLMLGLGKVDVRIREKIQPSGGRLDMVLEDHESDPIRRYECELQLGATDESHIIRTIEYWDIERKRYPQYDHVAVLVAEEVTGRFLNVLHLFNGHIPLIVLKVSAFEIDGEVALTFVKVLDEVKLGIPEEEEAGEKTDRPYWEKQSCKEMMKLTDYLCSIIQEIDSKIVLNYNKYYIGLTRNNIATNFCWFKPRKAFVNMGFKPIPPEDVLQQLEKTGLEVIKKTNDDRIFVKISETLTDEQKDTIKPLIEMSRKAYGLA